MWMGVVGEGGKGGVILTLLDVSSTSCSLDARLALARRSLDARSTLARLIRVGTAGAAVAVEAHGRRSAISSIHTGFPLESDPGNPQVADLVRLTLKFYDFSPVGLKRYAVCCVFTY